MDVSCRWCDRALEEMEHGTWVDRARGASNCPADYAGPTDREDFPFHVPVPDVPSDEVLADPVRLEAWLA